MSDIQFSDCRVWHCVHYRKVGGCKQNFCDTDNDGHCADYKLKPGLKLWQFTTTEHNGEQEYSHDHVVYARTLAAAQKKAIKYCKNWYSDGLTSFEIDKDGYASFEFFGGEIVLDLNDITQTTEDEFKEKMFNQCRI